MADYYPILTRAIGALPEQDSVHRQAIYRRAREALERQLRSLDPPLGEGELLKETLALEDVIRRIEADFAELPPATPTTDIAPPAEPEEPPPTAIIQPGKPRVPDRPRAPTREEQAKGRRRLGLLAVGGVMAMLVMGSFAYIKKDDPARARAASAALVAEASRPADPEAGKREGRLSAVAEPETRPAAPPPSPAAPPAPTEAGRPAAPETTSVPPQQPVLPVASRAFMVLEVPGAAPNQFEGQVTWSFAADPATRSPVKVLRAAISYPAAGVSVDMVMSPNADPGIKASHTIFVTFDPKDALPAVREMSAIEWRERESQAGATMAGILVPIQDNIFLIGLDASETAKTRNLDLLRGQRWMVFEMRLANGRRGALLVEKGASGERAVIEALATWK